MFIFIGFAAPIETGASTPVATHPDESNGPVLPEFQDTLAERSDSLSRYRLDVALDPVMSTIGGQITVTWVNDTGETQSTLPFRLYPNAWYYRPGGITIEGMRVERMVVAPRFDDTGTVLFVDSLVHGADTAHRLLPEWRRHCGRLPHLCCAHAAPGS